VLRIAGNAQRSAIADPIAYRQHLIDRGAWLVKWLLTVKPGFIAPSSQGLWLMTRSTSDLSLDCEAQLGHAKMGSTTSLVGRSVLILEDEPLIALGLKDAFEAEGANVYLASNPNGALHLAKSAILSAAVLDFGSEGDSGSTLRRTLRAYGVPFLYYTGVDDLDEKSLSAPIVSKPAGAEVLITTVTKLLCSSPAPNEHRLRGELAEA
jgi:CheY-like chemotaxis protein